MNKILVKIEDYKKYTSKYNTDKLSDKYIIYTNSSFPKFVRENINQFFPEWSEKKINEEIFNGTPTEYKIIKSDSNNILIRFSSKSNTDYRLDLLKEPNNNIWHIAFSLFNSTDDNYHNQTNNNESIEVFSKLIWILRDISLNVDEYCIGATGSKKDNIYQYMMRFISGWEKRETDQYPLGWAIYFRI